MRLRNGEAVGSTKGLYFLDFRAFRLAAACVKDRHIHQGSKRTVTSALRLMTLFIARGATREMR